MKFILTTHDMGKGIFALDIECQSKGITSMLGRLLVDQETFDEIINIFQLGTSRYMEEEVTVEVVHREHVVSLKPTGWKWTCPICFWGNEDHEYSETVKCQHCGYVFGVTRVA